MTGLRYAGRILVILLLVALVVATIGAILVRRSFPQLDGELRLAGLDQPVDVYRDQYGVPHIYATTDHDLFFTQGYVHAQDRFWQMDFWRHIGAGRLSELLGSSTLDDDRFLRTLGWEQIAQQEWEMADDQSKRLLEAYAEGVNAYLAGRDGAELSFEYAILKLVNWSYEPAPWTPVNTITFGKVMAWELRQNIDREIDRALLLADLTKDEVALLYPPYPADKPVIVPGSGVSGPTASQAPSVTTIQPLLAAIDEQVAALDGLLGGVSSGLGSNNWAVAGEHTETGRPILANDPHLPIQMPSIWYEVGLHCVEVGTRCGFESAGFSFAGVPGVIIGHNGQIAWGFTNSQQDVMDLYIEEINPDNPDQYRFRGEWRDMDVRTEVIEAPGEDPLEVTVRSTHHGPIISEVATSLKDFGDRAGVSLPEPFAIALSWTALEPTSVIASFLDLNQAQNWGEFRAALSQLDVPGQNVVYADADGNIGYQSTGRVPVRAEGDGTIPVPGWTGTYEWTGFVPFGDLPRSFNPSVGYVVTANNRPAGNSYPHHLSDVWAYGYRAQRITDMLEDAGEPIGVGHATEMQADARDLFAPVLIPYLLDVVPESNLAREGQTLLALWGQATGHQMLPNQTGAAIYAAVWRNLLDQTFTDDLGGEFLPEGGSRWFEVVGDLLEDPEHPWWDNKFTAERENRDAILLRSLNLGMQELSGLLGGGPRSWRWGDLHRATFENLSLGQSGIPPVEWLFNRGSYPTGGSASVPNATGWLAPDGYGVAFLPSMRMVVDLADFDASQSIHTTGQSGHTFHDNYIDLAEDWAATQTHNMVWSRATVEAAAVNHLRLVP